MDSYITGNFIKELREKRGLTQAELAEVLHVSDKTVSKWETGKGYPDIALLEPLAAAFRISMNELFASANVVNRNLSSNMLRSKFYVCPICGNVIHSMGELSVACHGVTLTPETAEPCDEGHEVSMELVEDDYFVQIHHEMTKTHYISFVAALSADRLQMVKLYPEGNPECRFPRRDLRRIVYYCNRDGMYYLDVKKAGK